MNRDVAIPHLEPEILEADVAAACPPPELIRTIQLDVLDQHVVQCDLQGRPVHPDFERIPLLRTLVGQGERGDEIVEGAGGANGGRRAIVPQVDFEPGTGEVPVKRGVQEDSALAPAHNHVLQPQHEIRELALGPQPVRMVLRRLKPEHPVRGSVCTRRPHLDPPRKRVPVEQWFERLTWPIELRRWRNGRHGD